MANVFDWAAGLWNSKYEFSYEVRYNRTTFHTALRNNFASGRKSNVEVEFTIFDGNDEKHIKGWVCSVTSSGHGVSTPLQGFFEIRFNRLWEKKNGKWDLFLDEDIVKSNIRELVPDQMQHKIQSNGTPPRKWSDFVVLKIGWNPNTTQVERFQCNFTQFFWKLMTAADLTRNEWGDVRPFGSHLIAFDE